ncbi:hypothetical protein ZOSMA_42G00800, partial [Zostera marina]
VFYSRKASLILHSLPTIIYLLLPFLLHYPIFSLHLAFVTSMDLVKGTIFHTLGIILAIIVPVIFAIVRLLFSNFAMTWFANPFLGFLMFIPSSIIGLLIPRTVFGFFAISQDGTSLKKTSKKLSNEAYFWGAFSFYGFLTLVYLLSGLGGGFLAYILSMSMAVAWFFFRMACKRFGDQSIKSFAAYMIPMVPVIIYAVYFSGFLVQFLVEKMGMMGSLPQPYGYFVPDIVVAAVIGVVTGLCVGPLLPFVSYWLCRPSILKFLLQFTVIALAVSSQFFPYSTEAPKRVVLQHTFRTDNANRIVNSSYDFSVVDANSLEFLFKHAPDASKMLEIYPNFSLNNVIRSDRSSSVALFPISSLFSTSMKFPVKNVNILDHYQFTPQLSLIETVKSSKTGSRKVHLELYLGSLKEVWVAVLNITGPLSNWSFANSTLPAPETIDDGPPSYICRLSGNSHENWNFWLEANHSNALQIDVAVIDQYLTDDTKNLKSLFPRWADVIAYTSFLSSYYF